MACVKAKQRCEGVLVEEKRSRAESAGLGEVVTVLRDFVEVLRGIRSGMERLEEAFDGHWAAVGGEEEESEGEEVEEEELVEELMGLLEEAADYRAFWRAKYGKEYQAVVLGKDGKNVEEELGEEKEKEKELGGDEGDEMEVDGMVTGPSGSVA